jgi:hypothetical protein
MGDLLIGSVYPPSLGNIKKMMVGDEQVWPRPDPLIIENWPALFNVFGVTPYVFGNFQLNPSTPDPTKVYSGTNDGLGGTIYDTSPVPSTGTWYTGLKLPAGSYELGEAQNGGAASSWHPTTGDLFINTPLTINVNSSPYNTTVYVREKSTQELRKIMVFGSGSTNAPVLRPPEGVLTPITGSLRFMKDGTVMGGSEGQAAHNLLVGHWGGVGYSVRINRADNNPYYNSGTSPLNRWFSVAAPSGNNQPYVSRVAAEGGGSVRWAKFKIEIREDNTGVITTYFVTLSTRQPPESSVSYL